MIALFSFRPSYKISNRSYKNNFHYFSCSKTICREQCNSASKTKNRKMGGSYSCSTELQHHSFNGRGERKI
jgi:hypothetical protein